MVPADRHFFSDLIRYYFEETGGRPTPIELEPPVPEVLQLLQRRLKPSLYGRVLGDSDPNNDVFHEVLDEDWVKREGLTRRIYLQPQVAQSLRVAASDVLGCSVDVAWLAAIMGAMFRLFPSEPCFHLVLKCGCRDGPNERQMVGFLSENRIFSVDVGDVKNSTLLDVAHHIAGTRRQRAWHAPQPFESGMCIYVNIVSAMTGSLPKGFEHVPKPSTGPRGWNGIAYAHLNLRIDQLQANDWDIRIFHWDGAWGWDWSTHFCHALGGTIYDMVAAPTEPLWLPPHKRELPQSGYESYQTGNGDHSASWKRSSDTADVAASSAEEPPAKAPRIDSHTEAFASNVEEPDVTASSAEEPPAKAPRVDSHTEDFASGVEEPQDPPAKDLGDYAAADEDVDMACDTLPSNDA